MADNIDVTPGSGKTVATTEIGGFQYQKIIAADPNTGTAVDVTATVNVAQDTAAIKNGATSLTPKFAAISLAASGDILALVAAKKIRVVSLFLVVTSAVTVKFQSGASSDLTGAMPFGANGGISLPYNPVGWFQTVSGEKLNMVLGSSVQVSGGLTYIEV